MKRVCFVMQSLLPMPPVSGGAVETLVTQLLDTNEREGRFAFTVCCREDLRARRLYGAYTHTSFVPIPVPRAEAALADLFRRGARKLRAGYLEPEFPFLLRVCHALRDRRFDAVVVENQPAFVHRLAALGVGPVCLHMHNQVQTVELNRPADLGRECQRLIGVSGYICAQMEKAAGAQPGQAVRLLNCIDVERFSLPKWREERPALRQKLGIAPEQCALLYIGRICPEKGALELAKAFVQLRLQGAVLLFVGSRWFGEAAQDAYQQQLARVLEPVRDQVRFTGYVPYAQVPGYYAAADLAVLPSIWEEPSMLTALEAQAAGLPVISTHSGGIPDNTCPQSAALLQRGPRLVEDLAETIARLVHDRDERERMSQAARAFMQERDCGAYYRQFTRLMDEIGRTPPPV